MPLVTCCFSWTHSSCPWHLPLLLLPPLLLSLSATLSLKPAVPRSPSSAQSQAFERQLSWGEGPPGLTWDRGLLLVSGCHILRNQYLALEYKQHQSNPLHYCLSYKYFYRFYSMGMGVLPAFIDASQVYTRCLQRPEESVTFPQIGVVSHCVDALNQTWAL